MPQPLSHDSNSSEYLTQAKLSSLLETTRSGSGLSACDSLQTRNGLRRAMESGRR